VLGWPAAARTVPGGCAHRARWLRAPCPVGRSADTLARVVRVYPSYHQPMSIDAELADRIRDLLTGSPGVTEQKMFGGLAFLIGGNLALACSDRGLLVRVGPDEVADVIARTNGELAVMGNRRMKGWVRVPPGDQMVERLADWVELGAGYARALPAKR
jgi:hypothetical protein